MKKQTAQQQVKYFCRSHGLTVDGKGGCPMISKNFGSDKWFIECFDTWDDALIALTDAKNKLDFSGKIPMYCIPNFK